MRSRFPSRFGLLTLSVACLGLLAACHSSSSTGSASAPAGGTAAASTGAAPAGVAAAANLPGSCGAIASTVDPYVGGISSTKSLGSASGGVSCEFANSDASTIVVVNIGQGSAAAFATLQAKSGGGGRTITPVSGLGTAAFSISSNGVPGGEAALSPQNVVFSVTANIPFAKDQSLIERLMKQY